MSTQKKHYRKEFKEKAVALSYERANIKELAEELGVDVPRYYLFRTIW